MRFNNFNNFTTSTGGTWKGSGRGMGAKRESSTEVIESLELLPFPIRRKGLREPLTIESRLKFNGGAA